MANIKQQKKRVGIAQRQRLENLRYKSTAKTLFRSLQTQVDLGDKDAAGKVHTELVRLLDRAAARNAMHSNTAARKKSRAARILVSEPVKEVKTVRKSRKKAPARAPKADAPKAGTATEAPVAKETAAKPTTTAARKAAKDTAPKAAASKAAGSKAAGAKATGSKAAASKATAAASTEEPAAEATGDATAEDAATGASTTDAPAADASTDETSADDAGTKAEAPASDDA